jgi:competence protein ComEA
MNTTPQERMALGTFALLVSLGVGARLLRHPDPVELTGAGVAADSAAFGALEKDVDARAQDAAHRGRPLAPGETVDLNTAAEGDLDRLPRVGPGQAHRIATWRQSHGPFRTLADLDSVPGMGAAALAAVAPYVGLPAGESDAGGADGTATRREAGTASRGAAGAVDVGDGHRPVNVNTATAEELQTLPGIGPALARRIVEHRAAQGPFRSAEELEKVPGIGPTTATRLRGRITTSS